MAFVRAFSKNVNPIRIIACRHFADAAPAAATPNTMILTFGSPASVS